MNIGQKIKSMFRNDRFSGFMVRQMSNYANLISENDYNSQLAAFKSYLYSIVNRIGLDVSAQNPILYLGKRGDAEGSEVIYSHPFLDRLRQPMSTLDLADFTYSCVGSLDLVGNGIIYIRPDSFNNLGLPLVWEFIPMKEIQIRVEKGIIKYIRTHLSRVEELENDYVIHFKYPSPFSTYIGFSPVIAASYDMTNYKYMQLHNAAKHANGGSPSGIISTKRKMNEVERRKMRNEIEKDWIGAENTGKILIVSGTELEYVQNKALEDMDFSKGMDTVKQNLREIYSVSKANIGDVTDVNRSNNETQEDRYAEKVILSRRNRIANVYTKILQQFYDKRDNRNGGELWIDIPTEIVGNKEFKLMKAKTLVMLNVISEETVRREYNYSDEDAPLATDNNSMSLNYVSGKGKLITVKDFIEDHNLAKRRTELEFIKGLRPVWKWLEDELQNTMGLKDADPLVYFAEDKFNELIMEVQYENMMNGVKREMNVLNDVYSLGLKWDFVNELAGQEIKDGAIKYTGEITKKTQLDIQSMLKRALEEGWTNGEKTKRVKELINEYSGVRSERIVRTETTMAQNFSAKEMFREAHIEYLCWLSSGADVRESHVQAEFDNEKVSIKDMFYLSLSGIYIKYAGDRDCPVPGEIINCKCINPPALSEL